MSELPLVTAFYTVGTPYEQEVRKLMESVHRLKMEADIRGVPDLGSWEKNTHHKASFVKQVRADHPGRAVLYVDADAVFNDYPEYLRGFEADIGIRYQDFSYRKNECLSGTICFGTRPVVDELIDRWIEINSKNPAERGRYFSYEQVHLGTALAEFGERLIVDVIPPEYCFIFDSMRRIYPNAKPVIEHFQASRRFAKRVPRGRR